MKCLRMCCSILLKGYSLSNSPSGVHLISPDYFSSSCRQFQLLVERDLVPDPKMARQLHRSPPFRAEHLGSLLRPDDLLKTRDAVNNGTVQNDELIKIEDRAVKEIVDLQIKFGFHAVTDGEYRRHSMSRPLI